MGGNSFSVCSFGDKREWRYKEFSYNRGCTVYGHKRRLFFNLPRRLATDFNHLSSKLGMGMSEGCFIFDSGSEPLKVARPNFLTVCTKVVVKTHHRHHHHHHIIS